MSLCSAIYHHTQDKEKGPEVSPRPLSVDLSASPYLPEPGP